MKNAGHRPAFRLFGSIIIGAELEVGLRMGADGAYGGGAGADVDVAAVAAHPDLLGNI